MLGEMEGHLIPGVIAGTAILRERGLIYGGVTGHDSPQSRSGSSGGPG